MKDCCKDFVKKLCFYLAEHSEGESNFLTPFPAQSVNSHSLLDWVDEVTKIGKNHLSNWVEEWRITNIDPLTKERV